MIGRTYCTLSSGGREKSILRYREAYDLVPNIHSKNCSFRQPLLSSSSSKFLPWPNPHEAPLLSLSLSLLSIYDPMK